jgi:hypothetical protein
LRTIFAPLLHEETVALADRYGIAIVAKAAMAVRRASSAAMRLAPNRFHVFFIFSLSFRAELR